MQRAVVDSHSAGQLVNTTLITGNLFSSPVAAESDLLTFAQRKQHYESDKSVQQELFTSESRPQSVRQLYKESGKEHPLLPLSTSAITPSRSVSVSFNGDLQPQSGADDMLDGTQEAGAADELQCSDSDFGNANRKLRTRIDAEIEIRLVSVLRVIAIRDYRFLLCKLSIISDLKARVALRLLCPKLV